METRFHLQSWIKCDETRRFAALALLEPDRITVANRATPHDSSANTDVALIVLGRCAQDSRIPTTVDLRTVEAPKVILVKRIPSSEIQRVAESVARGGVLDDVVVIRPVIQKHAIFDVLIADVIPDDIIVTVLEPDAT